MNSQMKNNKILLKLYKVLIFVPMTDRRFLTRADIVWNQDKEG